MSFISRVVSVELDECKGWPISAVLPYSRPGRFAESGPEMMAFLGHGGGGESDRQEGGGTGSGSLQTMFFVSCSVPVLQCVFYFADRSVELMIARGGQYRLSCRTRGLGDSPSLAPR